MRSISVFDVAPHGVQTSRSGSLARQVASIETGNQLFQTSRQCPKCGSERFTQQRPGADR